MKYQLYLLGKVMMSKYSTLSMESRAHMPPHHTPLSLNRSQELTLLRHTLGILHRSVAV